jgi:hypothetical protein
MARQMKPIPKEWSCREDDGDWWRVRIENDCFDGSTQTVLIEGVYKCAGGEEVQTLLATPTPQVARQIADALRAHADAVEDANKRADTEETGR